MSKEVYREDLVAAVIAAMSESSEKGMSVREICEATGRSDTAVKKQLMELKSQGKVKVITYKVLALDDIMRTVRGYVLIK